MKQEKEGRREGGEKGIMEDNLFHELHIVKTN